ncbi:unannotated protein [freshwater metagenome]|uniref:Unannotated protein n=1 Tax=freshwater metagenome TaxID=449393 RepID=A0A6J6TJ61_9ZZZZ
MVAGWRVCTGTTPVPSSMVDVRNATAASAVSASKNGVWGTQSDAKPRASASTPRSTSADGVVQSAPENNPICMDGVAIPEHGTTSALVARWSVALARKWS